MTANNNSGIGRRPFIRGAGVALATLGGMSGSALAGGRGKSSDHGAIGHLADTEAGFAVFQSDAADEEDEPNDVEDFGFPNVAFLGGIDPGGGSGLFDGSKIRITPNHETLHHSFQLFGGIVMKGKPKPYTLVNTGSGVFESRGQTANFRARSSRAIEAGLTQALTALGVPLEQAKAKAEGLAANPPFSTLAGGKWRAVAKERLKVDLAGDEPFDSQWAATRVDLYSRGRGKPEHTLSLVYTLWANNDAMAQGGAIAQSRALIQNGRLNLGGP